MEILWKYAILSSIIFWFYLLDHGSFELNRRVTLISLEHPLIYYVQPEVARLFNITSRRPGQFDQTHYVHIWLEYIKPLDNANEITVNVHEFLSNEYRPSFVVMSFQFCNFFHQFLEATICYHTNNQTIPVPSSFYKKCYFKPGIYYFTNMTLPVMNLPENFPFVKGRVFINHTFNNKLVMGGYIDIELKTVPVRKYKGRK